MCYDPFNTIDISKMDFGLIPICPTRAWYINLETLGDFINSCEVMICEVDRFLPDWCITKKRT